MRATGTRFPIKDWADLLFLYPRCPAAPDQSAALQALLGYLNFAEGRPDPRFQKQLNSLYGACAAKDAERPWLALRSELTTGLRQLHEGGGSAFQNVAQAEAVIALVFDDLLPAYRRHHLDLLAHLSESDLWQPFFLARAFEAVLRQRGPWDERERIVAGALKQLNDYVGHRPIATLESRPQGEPYDHERVRPIPLYLREAGVAWGRYGELIAKALEILEAAETELLPDAFLDLKLLDELALDPRAYDFDHPADKRPNYVFGEWDPHCLDVQARYRRFVLRQITLEGLWQRVANSAESERGDALVEAAAVLAGTMLMAAGVSGAGPDTHDSTVTLTKLTPRIAKTRDAFYAALLQRLKGDHAQRLQQEAKQTKQPFGAARQALNQYLAQQRALQLQHRRLALFFADLGDAAASRRQLAKLPVASARIVTEIHILLANGRRHVERHQRQPGLECLQHAEDLLQRGIGCGALVDPWNILGFQGQYPRFQSLEDSVRDHRIGDLTEIVAGVFDLYARLMTESNDEETGALSKGMRRLADWWDRFATTTVSDVPHVPGAEAASSAEHVARALAIWRERGAAAGDLAFWREQIEEFRTPKAFAAVIEALLQRRDFRASSALLVTWLSHSEQTSLDDGQHSFYRLSLRWLLELASVGSDEAAPQAIKLFAYLEANADDWWNVPALGESASGEDFPPMPEADDGEPEEEEDSLYGAAYEDVTYRDSTDDGVEGEVLDFMPQKGFNLEFEAERLLPHLQFLGALPRLWMVAAPILRTAHAQKDPAATNALAEWLQRAQQNQQGLLKLLDGVHAHVVPKPTSAFDAVVEFNRRLQIKERLLAGILEASREHALAISMLRSLGARGAGMLAGPKWEPALLALETHLRQGERAAAGIVLDDFMQHFRDEPLVFTPLAHGGEPRAILRASLAHALLGTLVSTLPRQGMVRESWELLRLARAMEASQPSGARSVTEFHRPYQASLQAVVEAVLDAALREQLPALEVGAGLERVVEPFLPVWTDHFQTTRLGMLETIRSDDDWRKLVAFIRRYGRDLFTRRFLAAGSMNGVLQRGIGPHLDDLRENADPLHPCRLIDELDQPGVRAQAERWLRLILETLLENQDTLRDYNQTCPQADFGDNLHLLLEFLRLKTRYERAAWNFRPLQFVHDVLVRRHPASATAWREQVRQLTKEFAEPLLHDLTALELRHGMRLVTVRERVAELFVGPLEIDRLAALVEPAHQRARGEVEPGEPSELEQEVAPLADTPSGVGLDAPPWLSRLEHELHRIQQAQDQLARLAEARLQAPKSDRPFADLVKDFDGWEKAE